MELKKEHAEKIVPGLVLGYGWLSTTYSFSVHMELYRVKRITPSGRVVLIPFDSNKENLTLNPDMSIRGASGGFSNIRRVHIITEEVREVVYKHKMNSRFYLAKKLAFPNEILEELPAAFFEGLFLSLIERGMFPDEVRKLPRKIPLTFSE